MSSSAGAAGGAVDAPTGSGRSSSAIGTSSACCPSAYVSTYVLPWYSRDLVRTVERSASVTASGGGPRTRRRNRRSRRSRRALSGGRARRKAARPRSRSSSTSNTAGREASTTRRSPCRSRCSAPAVRAGRRRSRRAAFRLRRSRPVRVRAANPGSSRLTFALGFRLLRRFATCGALRAALRRFLLLRGGARGEPCPGP